VADTPNLGQKRVSRENQSPQEGNKRQKLNNNNAVVRDEMRINVGEEVAGSADWERSSMASGFSVTSKALNGRAQA
jgi:hypothetical protein